jgi:hypothetical protein
VARELPLHDFLSDGKIKAMSQLHMVAAEHLTFSGLVCCNTSEEQQNCS